MPEQDLLYPSSAASLFANAAREVRPPVVWTWCPACQTRTDQIITQVEDEFVTWICLSCRQFHKEKKEKNEHN